MTEHITIPTADGGAMPAEVSYPAEAPGKGVIIVPPIFGIEDGTREIMDHYAALGCVVVTPDMFWRTIPGTMAREGEGRAKADERSQNFDVEQGVKDLADVVAFLREMPQCSGKVALFGYCFGGRYALLAGTRLGVDGAVSFHGVGMGHHLDEADKLSCPLSIHVGDSDPVVPMKEIEAVKAAIGDKPGVEIRIYPGVGHGFTGKGRANYDETADTESNAAAARLIEAM
ncbi:MAG: dienelactone hydrolase family protein [Alphaproteobacteria bacterium]|nr:dienelactone hydrolase family protein [Alphaproteobacteria bacterium]